MDYLQVCEGERDEKWDLGVGDNSRNDDHSTCGEKIFHN